MAQTDGTVATKKTPAILRRAEGMELCPGIPSWDDAQRNRERSVPLRYFTMVNK